MKTIENTAIEAAAEALKNLGAPPKSDKPLTAAGAIAKLKPQLQAAQRRGWTPEQLIEVLSAQGVSVSVYTLKRHLRQPKKPAGQPPAKPAATTPEALPLAASGAGGEQSEEHDGEQVSGAWESSAAT